MSKAFEDPIANAAFKMPTETLADLRSFSKSEKLLICATLNQYD